MRFGLRSKLYAIGFVPVVLFVILVFGAILPEMTNVADSIARSTLMTKLDGDINAARVYLDQHFGEVRLEAGQLVDENRRPIGRSHAMVDQLSEDLGTVATIFQIDNNDFRRISTSIRDDQGQRVVQTTLGTDHPGYLQLSRGQRYEGETELFGESYFTVYEPLRDGEDVIGLLFMGVSQSAAMQLTEERVGQVRNFVTLAVAVMVVLLAIIIVLMANPMVRNIKDSTNYIVGVLAEGNFSVAVPEYALRLKDEFGDLARGLSQMQTTLQGMFRKIDDSRSQVSSSSQSIAASSEEMSASLEEIASSANEFASGAQTLGQNAQHMNDSSAQVSSSAKDGQEALADAVNQVDTIAASVEGLDGVIRELDSRTQDIGAIVDTMMGFSEQTNLLSLNAAIEAARAGDSGRGFAVVAEEVRKLAEQSTKSAAEITELVRSIQQQSGKTVTDIADSVKQVHRGRETIAEATRTLDAIINMIGEMTAQITAVSSAAQQIGSGSEEVSASVEEQTATMESIAAGTDQLSQLVEELNQELAQFSF